MNMSPSHSNPTRLLCASAFLSGSSFRRMTLKYLEDPSRAVAPEIGLDLRLVAQVCKFAQDRSHKFDWFLSACLLIALIGSVVDPTIGLVILVLSAGIVWFMKTSPERFRFLRAFAKPVFDPSRVASDFNAELDPEHLSSVAPADQNLVVYQGFSPFVGAGTDLGGWSFVVNVNKGKDEAGSILEPINFNSTELYSSIAHCLNSLGLNSLTNQDMFYIRGCDIRDDRQILPSTYGRPVSSLAANDAQKYSQENDTHVRHYKWIRITDWDNELTTSFFLRCTLRGCNLFVEINRRLLTPVARSYRKIDEVADEDLKERIGAFVVSFFVGPIRALVAPLFIFSRFQKWMGDLFDHKEKERRKVIDNHPLYNYGVPISFRECLRSDEFMHYFQKLDGDFYSKVLEREILSTIVSFLDEHNIDTSELKERQSTILNSGIIIHGGDVKAESLAVGTAAQATKITKPEPTRTPRFRSAAAGGSS
jgi:hypothetical protein